MKTARKEGALLTFNSNLLPLSLCSHEHPVSQIIYASMPFRFTQEHRVIPIIQHVLETNLAEQKYDPVFCKDVTVKITEEIKERVKKLCYPRYKFVCHVIVGDVNKQDVRVVSRCAWDAAVDRYAQSEYRSFYLYAVGIVYGIYCE